MTRVMVTVIDAETGATEQEWVIDHDQAKHRAWLGKTAYWAVRNGKVLVTKHTVKAFHLPRALRFVEEIPAVGDKPEDEE